MKTYYRVSPGPKPEKVAAIKKCAAFKWNWIYNEGKCTFSARYGVGRKYCKIHAKSHFI